MNIGSVMMNASGQLLGAVATMNFDAKIGFRPVSNDKPRAPKFDIVALNVARRWVRIGALWEKEAQGTGEIYLTGNIEDPSLAQKLYIAAFRQEDGSYSIVWNRSDPTAAGSKTAKDAVPSFDTMEGPPADYERDYGAPVAEDETAKPNRKRSTKAPAESELADNPFA